MDYEELRRLFIRFLQSSIEELEGSAEEFTQEFIKNLEESGYQITAEKEKLIEEWTAQMISLVQDTVTNSILVVASAHGMRSEEVAQLARSAFEHRWEDGKDLPQRLKEWDTQLKGTLRNILSQGIYRGQSALKIAYDLKREIDALPEEEIEKIIPARIKEIEEKLKPLVVDPKGRKKAQEIINGLEKEFKRYKGRLRTRLTQEELIRNLRRAIEKGSRELVERAIKVYTNEKLLSRLKIVAQSESAYAYGKALIEATPSAVAYEWRLSRSHPEPDICDVYANMDYGLGKGVHPRDKLPRFPAHPSCLCYLIPVAKRKGQETKELKLPEETMKRIAPKYVRNLEALGVDIKQLWDEKELRFLKRKELIQKVGEEEFKVLETIGRTIREGRWKAAAKTEYLEEDLLEIFGDTRNFPPEVRDLLGGKTEVNSLTYHYLKRKYVDRWNLKNPEELDEMFIRHIKNPEGLIYKQGDRIAIELDRFVAIIHPPDTKITLFKLKDKYRDYEDYANQMNMSILKLWRLKYILKRL